MPDIGVLLSIGWRDRNDTSKSVASPNPRHCAMSDPRDSDRLRLDKWLCAARFYKTRSLAAQAIEGGKVKLNGGRAKPSKDVKPGDVVELRSGELQWQVEVRAVSARRGPAAEAGKLYAESDASRAKREQMLAMRRAGPHPAHGARGRPTKRDRRMIRRFTGKESE
jgi:ribosome-associated heat shock protein Hsp15